MLYIWIRSLRKSSSIMVDAFFNDNISITTKITYVLTMDTPGMIFTNLLNWK